MIAKAPTQAIFLLADAIREEVGNKYSILGYYAGAEVTINGELDHEVIEGKQPLTLPLALLVTLKGGAGEHDALMRILDPNGVQMLQTSTNKLHLQPGKTANLIAILGSFPVKAWGRFSVTVEVGKRTYPFDFIIRHSDPNVRLPAVGGDRPGLSADRPTPSKRARKRIPSGRAK